MAEAMPPLDIQQMFKLLWDIFPNADPKFLHESVNFIHNNADLNDFIDQLSKNPNHPSKRDSIEQKLRDSYLEKYQNNFNVNQFCEEFPNAPEYFEKINIAIPQALLQYIVARFSKIFPNLSIHIIDQILRDNYDSVLNAYTKLSTYPQSIEVTHSSIACELPEIPDISKYKLCFQILAYFEYKEQIEERIQVQRSIVEYEESEAKQWERLVECQCCFGNDFPASMIVTCKKGHEFCKECVQKSSEILMVEQQFTFPCLTQCNSFFSDETINNVIDKQKLSTLNRHKQLAELKKAGLDDLEACIHCSVYQLISPDDKVFECLNPECLRATCRKCLKNEHTPYKCEEIHEEVKRLFVENKMSEAIISTCWKCGLKFTLIDGCNKITCRCGAKMCYLCKKPINDYSHFDTGTCPQYVHTQLFHQNKIEEAEKSAAEKFEKLSLL